MNTIRIFALLLSSITATNVSGQEIMSLMQCRQRAIATNDNLKIARLQHEQAREQQSAARTMRLPSLAFAGTAIYQDKDFETELTLPTVKPNPLTGELEPNIMIHPLTGEPVIGPDGNPVFNLYAWMPLSVSLSGAYQLGLTLQQPVYAGGKIEAGNRMAEVGVEMASGNIELYKNNTLLEADNAYWTFVSLSEKVKLATQAVAMLEELVARVQNTHEVGFAQRNDLMKASVELNTARLNLQRARNGYELSRMDLCRITGYPAETHIVATDTIIEAVAPLLSDSPRAKSVNRPEYKILERNIALQDQNIRMVRADFLPVAGLQASYNHLGGIEFSGTEFDNTSLNVMASVKIPLFHWGEGMRKIRSAQIEKQIKEAELSRINQLLQLEAEQAAMSLMLAWERIRMNEKALEQADENLRLSRDNYEVGMETISEVLIAQTQWQQAYSELIDAKAEFRKMETAWEKVNGTLGE
jgi:outer membrane protein TolC